MFIPLPGVYRSINNKLFFFIHRELGLFFLIFLFWKFFSNVWCGITPHTQCARWRRRAWQRYSVRGAGPPRHTCRACARRLECPTSRRGGTTGRRGGTICPSTYTHIRSLLARFVVYTAWMKVIYCLWSLKNACVLHLKRCTNNWDDDYKITFFRFFFLLWMLAIRDK
jgi:hypothetical protein